MNKKVCAVVVTYNRLALLKKCLHNLFNQVYGISHILIFNNNSQDGTTEWLDKLAQQRDKCFVYNSSNNLGGAGGFSEAVKLAYKLTKDDYLWIMDDDTMPTPNLLNELILKTNSLNYQFGFLCSSVLWKDQSIVNAPMLEIPNWYQGLEQGVLRVERATFVSILFSRQIVAEIGIPSADMVIWGDDSEYTTRISTKYPSYLVPQSQVYHATPIKSVTIINDDIKRLSRYYYGYRNNLVVARLYAHKRRVVRIIIEDILLINRIIFAKTDHKLKRLSTIFRGLWSGLWFRPRILTVND